MILKETKMWGIGCICSPRRCMTNRKMIRKVGKGAHLGSPVYREKLRRLLLQGNRQTVEPRAAL